MVSTSRRLLRSVLAIASLLFVSCGVSQTVEVAAVAAGGPSLGGSVAVLGMRDDRLVADLRVGAVRAGPGQTHALLQTRIVGSTTVGVVGAATLELQGAFRSDGNGAARLAGQGVLGPVSASLGVSLASADPDAFSFSGVAPLAAPPRIDAPRMGLDGRFRYRIDRNLLLTFEPDLVLAPGTLAVRTRGSLRARQLFGEFDGIAELHAYLAPGDSSPSAALGVGAIWAPRRAPEWQATLWLGSADGRLTPGLAVRGAAAVGPGLDLSLDLNAEPFREDVPPYRGSVSLDLALGPHEAFVLGEAVADPTLSAAVTMGVRFALSRP